MDAGRWTNCVCSRQASKKPRELANIHQAQGVIRHAKFELRLTTPFPLYAKGSIGLVTAIAGLPFSDTAIPPMETDLTEMINHTPLMKDEPIEMFSLMHFIDDHLFQNCWTPAEAQMFGPIPNRHESRNMRRTSRRRKPVRTIKDFSNSRQKAWCVHSGAWLSEVETNRDHAPSKSLLQRPWQDKSPSLWIASRATRAFRPTRNIPSRHSAPRSPARQIPHDKLSQAAAGSMEVMPSCGPLSNDAGYRTEPSEAKSGPCGSLISTASNAWS
jgi:hypothetical protein